MDESDGTLLWKVGLFNPYLFWLSVGRFVADDDVGAYLSYSYDDYPAILRLSLTGEMLGGIGEGPENEHCFSPAIDLDGNIAISCVWAETWEFAGVEIIHYLERRSPDNVLLQGGFGEPPDLYGQQVFESDGDVILTPGVWGEPAIYKLDDDLEILSADPLESSPRGVVSLPDGDLILSGWEDGAGFLRRYAGCEP